MNKYFITGFVAGEGSFGIYKLKHRPNSYNVLFTINVHRRDSKILNEIKTTLKCGHIFRYPYRPKIVRFQVSKKKEISDKLIPFMDKYLLACHKRKQYREWRKKLSKVWKDLPT